MALLNDTNKIKDSPTFQKNVAILNVLSNASCFVSDEYLLTFQMKNELNFFYYGQYGILNYSQVYSPNHVLHFKIFGA